ncbi:MAG: proline dehydrogenase family protein [Candidatus Niyogibacteria bacterium]|nr:proline dehydrogenase family protein [Candidatus Niyogibacteria bacterium]
MIFAGIAAGAAFFLVVLAVMFLSAVGLKRFTAGSSIESALVLAKAKNREGIRVILNYAAEEAETDADAERVSAQIKILLDEMTAQNILGDIAVKPSALVVHRRSPVAQKRLYVRLSDLARYAGKYERMMWIDREHAADHPWVLPVEKKLLGTWKKKKFIPRFSNIGLVVQAYRANASKIADAFVDWHRAGARFRVRVCRGVYASEAQLPSGEIAEQFLKIHQHLTANHVPTVAATHTLVWEVVKNSEHPPVIHMLYGRKEVETVLCTFALEGRIAEPAVYVIYGPLHARMKYLIRRFTEDWRLIFWLWR